MGRKIVICKVCQKSKYNYGYGMCTTCLRNYKRKTKPSFYLGTCYSEMTRRCKTFDPLRPNYFGKEICSKEEFLNRFLTDNNFLLHYKNWQENDHKRRFSPSIDRVNNLKGYTLNNMQFISHLENTHKRDK